MTRSRKPRGTGVGSRAPSRRQRASLLAALGLAALSGEVSADTFALPPETADVVRRAFEQAAPGLRLESASIETGSIRLRACRPSGTCHAIALTHPADCPGGVRAGPFCSTAEPPLDPEGQATLARAFAPVAGTIWKPVTAPPPTGLTPSSPPPTTPTTTTLPWLFYAGALAFGAVVGRLLRHAGGRNSLLLMVAVGAAIACTRLPLPPLDAVAGMALAWLVASLVRARRPARATLAFLLASGFTLGAVEGLLRLAVPAPADPGPPPPFLLDATAADDYRCHVLADRADPTRLEHAPAARPKNVLHLGDSMLLANGLPDGTRATDVLEGLQPDTRHWNAGVAGTGPDLAAAIAPRLLARVRPSVVVVHLFAGNDADDVVAPLPCCPDGPLLENGPAGLQPRCDLARWRFTPVSSLQSLRAPYPVLAAARVSHLAGHTARATKVAGLRLARMLPRPGVDPAAHLSAVVASLASTLAQDGRRVLFVVIPDRPDVRAAAGGTPEAAPAHLALVEAARASGADTVDARPFLVDAFRTHGEALFMDTIPDDPHFTSLGHGLYARFLAAQPALSE